MQKNRNYKSGINPCVFYYSSSNFSPKHFYLYRYKYKKTLKLNVQDLSELKSYKFQDTKTIKKIIIEKDRYTKRLALLHKVIKAIKMPQTYILAPYQHPYFLKMIKDTFFSLNINTIMTQSEESFSNMLVDVLRHQIISSKFIKLGISFSDNSGEKFIQNLYKMSFDSLKYLSLKFLSDESLNNDFAAAFAALKLFALKIHFTNSHYFHKDRLRVIAQIIEVQQDLSSFDLMFFGYQGIVEDELKSLYQSLISLKQLKTLKLKLNSSPSVELRNLIDSIAILNIQNLILKFGEISTNELSCFENLAKSLKYLHSIYISIENGGKIHNDSFSFLGKQKSFPKLKKFKLIIKNTNISVIAFQHFKEFFVSHPDLWEFCLTLCDAKNITDETLEELGIGLGYCPEIKVLYIEFMSCPALTNEIFFTLANSLSLLESIKRLKLAFSFKASVSTRSFTEFLEELGKQKSLTSLCLKFPLLKFEREEDLLEIYQNVKNMSRLGDLELAFRENSFQYDLINKLLTSLKQLLDLKVSIFSQTHSKTPQKEELCIKRSGSLKLQNLQIDTYHE